MHISDATCYERLQTLRLCDGPLPVTVAPFLHEAFVLSEHPDQMLVAAAGALTLLRRVEGEAAVAIDHAAKRGAAAQKAASGDAGGGAGG